MRVSVHVVGHLVDTVAHVPDRCVTADGYEPKSYEIKKWPIAHDLPASTSRNELLTLIKALNADDRVDGILLQLPLPKGLDSTEIMDTIDPRKDVDGFHPTNTGLLAQKRPGLRPCTPWGVIRLAEEYELNLVGLRACVVGASNIVGRPMALELLLARSTVTVCHTGTRDLRGEVERADLVVVPEVGTPGYTS